MAARLMSMASWLAVVAVMADRPDYIKSSPGLPITPGKVRTTPDGYGLYRQTQEARELGWQHGLAECPLDLRQAFAQRRWPGSPILRHSYKLSAHHAISALVMKRARLEVAEAADQIGGIMIDQDGNMDGEAEFLLMQEAADASNILSKIIDDGPEMSIIRLH